MSDPVTNAGLAIAQFAVKEGFKYIATKAADSNCSSTENASLVHKTFCMVMRGAAGSDEKEFKEKLSSQVSAILDKVTEINSKVTVITGHLNQLVREMGLARLEIGEAVIGAEAYKAIQEIQVKYELCAERLKRINVAITGSQNLDNELKVARNTELTPFFKDLLFREKLYEKIDLIHNALVSPDIPGKKCLLRNVIEQISIKADNLLDCYMLYQGYMSEVMIPLFKGNFLVENAVKYCETLIEQKELNDPPPYSRQQWKDKWNERLKGLFAGFNTHLEWFVLKRSAEAAKGINPFFLAADAREVFRLSDAFCSRHLGYGLRGRIFSMGGEFDGKLKFKDGSTAAGVESKVQIIGEKCRLLGRDEARCVRQAHRLLR